MKKKILTLTSTLVPALAALTLAVPSMADDQAVSDQELSTVLASDIRNDDRARDKYRNPAETLAFFQVKPEMAVVEYGPGGGWYTRVLAPYVAAKGKYIAVNADSDASTFTTRAREGRAKAWPETFPARAAEWTGLAVEKITAIESDEAPEELAGTVDRILIVRSIHGMLNGTRADSELRHLRAMLKDDGMVGVVQHRAKANASFETSRGTRAYVKQADVIKLFELNGFELVSSSEINANPKDPADWEGGSWTLPPVLRYGDKDREKYLAIGESDRMTLLFKKAD